MLSLAYIVSQYPTVNHTFVLREVRALRAQGFNVLTISVRGPDRDPSRLTPEEADEAKNTLYLLPAGVFPILAAHLRTFLTRPVAYMAGLTMALRLAGLHLSRIPAHLIAFAEAVVIGQWARQRGFSHLHTHFVTNATMLAARIFPLQYSMTIHGPDEFNDVVSFHLAEKIARSRFACAISNFGKSQMMRATPAAHWDKIEYCYLGVDPRAFEPRAFLASPQPFRVVSVSRLAPVKGHRVLIDAIHLLAAEGRNVELVIAGDGPERKALEQHAASGRAASQIRFPGALTQPDVLALYASADCFALASFAEGIPVVLMEAMSMEVPCVATWVNGIPELIEDEHNGLLVPPSDAAGVARQIARLIDDRQLRERLGKAGRKRVLESFDLQHNAALLAGIFQRRLAR
ncbi:MAG: glycosyltransferase family 4 protein [Bryobacteraceae bacterium]